MFAQLGMNGKLTEIKPDFVLSTEKPIFKGFIFSVIAGTLIGGYLTAVWLMHLISPASLVGAVTAGAAVGANAGLLFFGLVDVVFNGRLEENAELIENAEGEDFSEDEEKPEEAGQEEYAFTLPKAS